MQFERIRKNHKRKIVIGGLILVCVVSAITITTTKAKYKLTQDIPLVRGTINYKVSDMRVVALYTENDNGEYVENNDIPKSGYALNREKSMCRVYDGSTSVAEAPKDEKITIEYRDGEIYIGRLTKKNTRCYLYFDKYIPPITIDNIIAGLTVKTGTPTFSNIATTDEGVYKVSDGMYGGYSYYWRGATINNYVKFGGFCWRIVRINGDKTMRLIYDGATCHANGTKTAESVVKGSTSAEKYYATSDGKYDNSSYVGWTYSLGSQRTTGGTASNAKTQTEKWYDANITGTNASKVADGKFCNDRNVGKNPDGVQGTWSATGAEFYYAGYYRLRNDYAPTLSCTSGDTYTLKVGAITADEVEFAGGKNANNTSYYLYNGQNYWTMSPNRWYGYASVCFVNSYGNLAYDDVHGTYGLRPVINLRSDTQFQAGGNGTLNNPYVVV